MDPVITVWCLGSDCALSGPDCGEERGPAWGEIIARHRELETTSRAYLAKCHPKLSEIVRLTLEILTRDIYIHRTSSSVHILTWVEWMPGLTRPGCPEPPIIVHRLLIPSSSPQPFMKTGVIQHFLIKMCFIVFRKRLDNYIYALTINHRLR